VCPCAGSDKDACRIRTQHDPVARASWPPSIKAKIAKDGKVGTKAEDCPQAPRQTWSRAGYQSRACKIVSSSVPEGRQNAASQTRYCRHCDPGMERRGRRPLIDDAVRNVSARCSCGKTNGSFGLRNPREPAPTFFDRGDASLRLSIGG